MPARAWMPGAITPPSMDGTAGRPRVPTMFRLFGFNETVVRRSPHRSHNRTRGCLHGPGRTAAGRPFPDDDMNFQQLRSAREAVRCGFNLTDAAHVLHTSQPGVSRQIRELEEELGIDLFVRSGKRLTGLTEPGGLVMPIIEPPTWSEW